MEGFFQKIIDVLNSCEIPYMLSGSVAMSLYIVPRATQDFDFVVHLRPQDIDRFVENFKEGYYCDKDAIEDAVQNRRMFNIIDHATGFKADFVVLKNEPFRQNEFTRRIPMEFFGKTIYVVSPEDLIISKLIWIQKLQSAIQMADIRNLVASDNLDWEYINLWMGILKLNTFDLLNHE
ncbi:MAG TPA: DUF6036 family nucleotidyltransferase [Puia sp.]|nr:DUF6036 family nucleotidyltransferase [Puia sp.]